ncbi:rhomboid family intramembrane serine protease [Treponema brennaborense]|uniref:Rhomboid family protein n=1 Tax=Treponema brennaborense (strain DSM 12168 / CIP 105900 / DD5/3) TaxID=906968 RepID=F4LP44_TREBD|nr:Rhomboid family protein [Treponema brennaborense DSM 12168]
MTVKRKTRRNGLKVCYNAPVTLTFSLAAALILLLNDTVLHGLTDAFFVVPGRIGSAYAFDWKNALDYVRLFTHVLGHADWGHLISNLSFILLLGPLLEERYGSGMLALMMSVTAFVTGVLNACFMPVGLLGASGVAFMMILLASFTTITKNEIPLTFILIMILYMGNEIVAGFKRDDISSFAHIAGGLCGSLFGFLTVRAPRKQAVVQKAKPQGTKSGAETAAGVRTGRAAQVSAAGKSKPDTGTGRNGADVKRSAADDATIEISSIRF